MNYYHGSGIGGIEVLEPHISNHQKSLVYMCTNEVIATFYMVNNNFYTYGFSKESNIPIYTEYYKGALKDIYLGKQGYLYECEVDEHIYNPTNINCTFVSEKPVKVISCEVIEDIYLKLLDYEKDGRLNIQRYEELSEKQLINIENMIISEILSEKLYMMYMKRSSYSKFIKTKFRDYWIKALEEINM